MEQQNLAAQLQNLIKLQEIDSQAHRLSRLKQSKPQEMARIKEEFAFKQANLKEIEKGLTDFQLKLKEKEMDLGSKEDSIKKLQVKLYSLKTNKDYQTGMHEISLIKADMSCIEDDIIKILDEIDKTKSDILVEKENLKNEEAKFKQDHSRVESELAQIESELLKLNTDRQSILPGIDKKVLSVYERIAKSKADALAIAPVVNENCGGCHMNVTSQVVNEIQANSGIIMCERCSRILYLP